MGVHQQSLRKAGRDHSPLSIPRLTKEKILQACKERQLYTTPRLNENLYLQCFGIEKIENLEEYTGTKALWLEENHIGLIENIAHMHLLRCLFLQNNAIQRISGLHSLVNLQTLNLSSPKSRVCLS